MESICLGCNLGQFTGYMENSLPESSETEEANKPVEILLVEDSPTDALLAREALECSMVVNTLHHVENGVEAMSFLRQEGRYSESPRPGLVFLDLNMPRKGGLEVLREVRADESLKTIPIVILTTSKAEEDVVRSYGLFANCYVCKPVQFEHLVQVVREIRDFWFSVVTLPPSHK